MTSPDNAAGDDLPRVTYSNTDIDLSRVHAHVDALLPAFERQGLGQTLTCIVGEDRAVKGGTAQTLTSPIDSQLVLGTLQAATPATVTAAVESAAGAFRAWSARPYPERVVVVRRFARELSRQRYRLAMASLVEVGKSRIEAIGEAEEAVDLADYYASEMERQQGYRRSLAQARAGETTESLLLPFGVFAVVAPFNFPVALSVNMISAALVTGNTVVFKPADRCALTGRILVEAALDAGVPPGVINLVLGGPEVGQALVSHPGVAGVAFTGSHATGMTIARAAINGGYAKPVIAEMGGKNPAYVTAQADLDVAAQGVARSAFGLQGQKCSACSVVYVDEAVRAAFTDRLRAFTSTLRVGDPRAAATFMGPVHSEAGVQRFVGAVDEAKQAGQVTAGGRRLTEGALARGFFLEPTIVDLREAGRLTRDELFLPFLAVRGVKSLAEGLTEGNAVQYGLSAGVFTRDKTELDYFLAHVQAGVVYANRASGATTGAWPGFQTFCGWKGSGVTHKGGLGPHFLPQFTHEQSRTLVT